MVQLVKSPPGNAGDGRLDLSPEEVWQSTSVSLPGESDGLKSLVGYSPKGHKESDIIMKQLSMHAWLILVVKFRSKI